MSDVRLVEFLGRGGLVHYAFQFARGLRENGLDAVLVTAFGHELQGLARPGEVVELFRTWDPRPLQAARRSGVGRLARRAERAGRLALAWLRLLGYLERERPTWVQFGELLSPLELPFLLWLKRRRFRLADVCHNVAPFDPDPASARLRKDGAWRRALYGALYRSFDLVFVHGDWSRRALLRLYAVDPTRVVAIPHGNEALFDAGRVVDDGAGLRRRLGLPEAAPVALFFGTLIKYKGVEDLVRAFAAVVERVPGAHLVIAGYPMIDLAQLRAEIVRLGLERSVTLWPEYVPIADVPALLALAQVAVFPYRSIDQSGALLLACTFGLPVVATRVGGLPEVIEHGGSGLVVPPGDEAALAEAVAELLQDRARARAMGARARELAETRYSWREVGRQAAASYRAVEGERTARGQAPRRATGDLS